MTYRYGSTAPTDITARREAERIKRARAEIRFREQVRARLKVTGRRAAEDSPTLHPGDSPRDCAERLIAASMEAGALWEERRPARRAAA